MLSQSLMLVGLTLGRQQIETFEKVHLTYSARERAMKLAAEVPRHSHDTCQIILTAKTSMTIIV